MATRRQRHLSCLASTVAALAMTGSGCRIFRSDEWSRRDRCAARLPVLREEPARPYRIVKIVEGESETDLAWQACAEGAQAVLALGLTTETTVRHGGAVNVLPGGTTAVYGGRSRIEETTRLRGYAITYVPE